MSKSNKRKALIIVLSDLGSQGKREDTAGEAVKKQLEAKNFNVNEKIVIPDDYNSLIDLLISRSDSKSYLLDLILTVGGTGLSPRDITPQATKQVIDVEIPGLTELMRIKGYELNKMSIISRSVAGIRNNVLIINLPGSLRGATESLGFVIDQLDHLLNQIQSKVDTAHEEMNNED